MVRAGAGFTVVVLKDGKVRAWGNHQDGQANVPPGLGEVVQLSAGFNHSVAVQADGQIVIWGGLENGRGSIPARVRPGARVVAGAYRTVAVNETFDTDGDGLEDAVEVEIGTSPELWDSDGDGLGDRLELLSGLDPTRPTEAPDGTVDVLPAVTLTTFTVPSGAYRVETSTDMENWEPALPVIRNTAGYREFQLSAPGESRLYRVVPLP